MVTSIGEHEEICKRKLDDLHLSVRIEDAFHDNRGIYGSPRIHAELKEQGIHCGRKRIVRLVRQLHMMAKRSRRKAQKQRVPIRFQWLLIS